MAKEEPAKLERDLGLEFDICHAPHLPGCPVIAHKDDLEKPDYPYRTYPPAQ